MKIYPTQYSRGTIKDRNHIVAIWLELHQAWVLRCIDGSAYFYNFKTSEWVYGPMIDSLWRSKMDAEDSDADNYLLSFEDMMKAMETVPSAKEINSKVE